MALYLGAVNCDQCSEGSHALYQQDGGKEVVVSSCTHDISNTVNAELDKLSVERGVPKAHTIV